MIWLTWRQHRRQALFTLVALGILAAIMVPTGLAMHHDYVRSGLASCQDEVGTARMIRWSESVVHCQQLRQQFQQQYDSLAFVAILFVILPVFAGLFFGAPLVAREVEQGTHRLVWTQGVSRRRWALAKFGLVGAAAVLLATVYALGMTWWFAPLSHAVGRLDYLIFDAQGIVPIGYTLFAVALGIFSGTLWRKVLPAMGVALAGFAGVRLAVEVLARRHYMTPKTIAFSFDSALQPNPSAGDWLLAQGVRNAAGQLVAPNSKIGPCGPGGCGPHVPGIGPGAYNWQLYQPGSRFWLFQSIETGIFVVLTVLLIYLAVRRLNRIA
ncbi:MAG TPA: ABC transporter permease subunit [Gaiellales bacterium]|nr:ABC transporter permease subunit [Gaiellales bacterium]